MNRAQLGIQGEEQALAHYQALGCRLIARNWRCPQGELDLVVADGQVLVVCEVKTRSSDAFGAGWEAVTAEKRARLRRLAGAFCAQYPAIVTMRGVRFDVASILKNGDHLEVLLFQDAF